MTRKYDSATSQPRRTSAVVISAGSKKLYRTVNGQTRVYDMTDEVSFTVSGRQSVNVVTPETRGWSFYGGNGTATIR